MLRLLLDEYIPAAVLRYLQRTYPARVEAARVVDVGLKGASDPDVLAWAAARYILVSHDKATLTDFAYERIRAVQAMPGVITITRALPLSRLLHELALIAERGDASDFENSDFENLVYYLP